MTWSQLIINTSAEHADALSEQLMELGALSVTLIDTEDEPLFQCELNETPLWQHTSIKALFSETDDLEIIKRNLKQTTEAVIQVERVEDEDWVRKTQAHFPPQCFADHFWVLPSWHTETSKQCYIKIDPGLAFGTGTHPTTTLCLTWLAENPPTHLTVIDYGCGSGILSLAALALGAKTAWSVDHDPQAIRATQNNAALNPSIQAEQLQVVSPEDMPEITADIIIANILANPLIELAPTLIKHATPKTTLILSGLLETEIERVTDAYAEHFTVTDMKKREGWAALILQNSPSKT